MLAFGARYNIPNVGQSAAVWSVSGKHDFSDELFVRGQAGTAFRLPTAEELFANDPDDERGDPNLKPEKSTNANLSVGGNFGQPHFKWELIAFGRNITNLIDYATFDATPSRRYSAMCRERSGCAAVNSMSAPSSPISPSVSITPIRTPWMRPTSRLPAVPVQQAKASFDYHPEEQPFGRDAQRDLCRGGVRVRTGADGDGTAEYGKYPVVDLAGRYFIDAHRHHIITPAAGERLRPTVRDRPGNGRERCGWQPLYVR